MMKNFKLNIIFRIIFIALSIFFFAYVYFTTAFIATQFIILFIIGAQIFSLIKYIDTTNKELARFLQSIKYSDFSQSFSRSKLGKSHKELSEAFNEVIAEFQRTRTEKEEQYRFLQTVIQHVGIGLISFNQDGKIEFVNNAAKKILKIPYLQNITSLNGVSKGLGDAFLKIESGEKTTVKLLGEDELIQLIVYATEFKMRNQRYVLLSLQNIQTELEEKEMEAWQKLIRVLTHEIMNSVTPISSLASTVGDLLERGHKDEETIKDIKLAIDTIKRRSDGLIKFVDSYRSLTRIPKPDFQIFQIRELFHRISQLMSMEFRKAGVHFEYSVEPDSLELAADPQLIEQALINMTLNSMQSLSESGNKKIKLAAHLDDRGKTVIKVIDNGPGISEELQEKIFIPFFSTKKEGSGIGLSLSRQIMRSHGGSIRISSKPFVETVFTLKFN